MYLTLMNELGKLLGLPDLKPDKLGAITLSIDKQHFIFQFFEKTSELYIIHNLGMLPEDKEKLLQLQSFLLQKNCFFGGVASGILGIEDKHIYYTLRLPYNQLSVSDLELFLHNIIDLCTKLRNEIDKLYLQVQNEYVNEQNTINYLFRV